MKRILDLCNTDQAKQELLLATTDVVNIIDDCKNAMQLALYMLDNSTRNTSADSWPLIAAILEKIDSKTIRSDLLKTKPNDNNSDEHSILQTLLDTKLRNLEKVEEQESFKNFTEFKPNISKNYNKNKNQHPLVILMKSNEGLIKHKYILKYIRYYWDKRFLRFFICGSLMKD